MCNIEKHIKKFYKKFSECKDCNDTRALKRYYENKDTISNQQKYIMKKKEKMSLQKQNNRSLQFRDLVISYVELENRLKTLEENDSEKH